jgi:poly(3-hydroxybutyrate) depolymerase
VTRAQAPVKTIVATLWSLLLAGAVGCGGGGGAKPADAGATGSAGASATGSGGTAGTGTSGSGGAAGSVETNDAGATAGDAGHSDAAPVDAGPSSARQTARMLGTNGAPNGYFEYLPPGYDGSSATPLLVFWHGIGEDGNGTSDLMKVLNWGPPKLIANDQWDAARPFIVLSPQYTATNGDIAPGGGCPSGATIDTFFTWVLAHYKIDAKRVYLTGLSCGAIGSWDYLAAHEGAVVAAAVLLAGNPGDPTQASSAWKRAGCALGTAAIWSFHGDADPTVPYAPDHDTVQDLIACPAPPRRDAKFTDIVGGGHTIWDPIYDLTGGNGDIYAWMLTNAKP